MEKDNDRHNGPEMDKPDEGANWYVEDEEADRDYDFSELDYEPRKKGGILLPILTLTLIVGLMAALIVFLGSRNDPEITVPEQFVEDEPSAEEAPGAAEESQEPEEEIDEEQDELEELLAAEEELPADYEQLDQALQEWLTERVNDPDVVMLPVEVLEEPEDFMGQYSDELNVVVFEVEQATEEDVTVLFGLPFREWSIKAVFGWIENEWVFLREESLY